jgi:seryl-tRNA synthetase
MDLRFLAGGLLSGVGQGIAMQGQQDILDRREQALATLRSATQQQLETQKETAASKRDAAKLASDKELQTQKDTAAGEREKTKVAGKSQSDAAAMARTRVSSRGHGRSSEAAQGRRLSWAARLAGHG